MEAADGRVESFALYAGEDAQVPVRQGRVDPVLDLDDYIRVELSHGPHRIANHDAADAAPLGRCHGHVVDVKHERLGEDVDRPFVRLVRPVFGRQKLGARVAEAWPRDMPGNAALDSQFLALWGAFLGVLRSDGVGVVTIGEVRVRC